MVRTFQLEVLAFAVLGSLHCVFCRADAGEARPSDSFRVGYRVLDLKYGRGEEENTLTLAVWYPTTEPSRHHVYGGPTMGNVALDAKPCTEGGPYPLLVFSHGYGGSGLSTVFLTEPLAARGWIVVAPDHHDRHSAVRIRAGQKANYDRLGLLRHAQELARSDPADRDAYLYRPEEMKLALDGMLESDTFEDLIDRERIAVGGHSFGGFTALGLCGTIQQRRDTRVKAILLFSTGAGGYLFRESEIANVRVPLMYFIGEREKSQKRGAKTMSELADKVYRNVRSPKYLLEVRGASHFSFNNRFTNNTLARLLSGTKEQFEIIRRYSIAFLEKHVAGREDADSVLKQHDGLLTRYVMER